MEVIKSKEVGLMDKTELLSVLTDDLKAAGVQTIDELSEFLASNQSFGSQNADQAYREFLKKELTDRSSNRPVFAESTKVGNYLAEKYSSLDKEEFIVLSIDNANHIISEDIIAIGSVDRAVVTPREVFRTALASGAVSIFVCHNHPSGNLLPSDADFKTTQKLKEAGEAINIGLLDHFIVGKGTYLSMAEESIF